MTAAKEELSRTLSTAEARGLLWHARNFNWRLRFAPALEAPYLQHRAEASLGMQRFSAILSVVLYLGFFALEWLVLHTRFSFWEWFPTAGLCAPLNLLYWWALYQPWGRRRSFVLSAAITALNALGIAVSSAAWMLGVNGPLPPEAPVIQQVYNTLLMGLPISAGLPLTTFTVLAFAAIHALAGIGVVALFPRIFMLSAGAMVGLLAAFVQEKSQRITWLRGELLRELSEHDGLTGLLNHRSFYHQADQRLRMAGRTQTPLSVMLVDLDHFKAFNDRHGHLEGDDCLRAVARVLGGFGRRPGDLVARLGGEEFALLLVGSNHQQALACAQALCKELAETPLAAGQHISASIGVASADWSQPMPSIAALAAQADRQLYAAKNGGRNTVR